MRSLFARDPTLARYRQPLPPTIRHTTVELTAKYPPFSLCEIATICRERFDRPVDHHTVQQARLFDQDGEASPG